MTTRYFCNASNFEITNITISHVSGNAVSISRLEQSERQGLRLLLDNVSRGAFHDAAERGDPPKCHPHTRVAIRAEIMDWVSAPDARRKFIIWMYGPAGSGKTAIAQSIAETYKKAASFFFSRSAVGRNDTKRVIATIAYQISLHHPQIQDHLFTAIERDPTIFSGILASQMQVLVVEPLKALPPLPQPIFVILDGLDEAGSNTQDLANLLNAIGTATEELQHIPLIFLIASRPEYEIRTAFSGRLLSPLSRSLVLDNNYKPDEDIRLYLTSTFEEIHDKHVRLGARLPSPWPSTSEVDRLVSKSSGQFIFAATVLKFIDSNRHHPAERLDTIFSLSARGHEMPFALLDALYYYILSSMAEPAKVLQILTMLVLRSPGVALSVVQIEELLDLDVRGVLVDMHALVYVPPSNSDHGSMLRFYHASLSDFLTDRSRSRDFFIDSTHGNIDLTRRWWKVIFNNQYFKELTLFTCLHNFVYHHSKSPAGIQVELADGVAHFNLKQHLEKHCDPFQLLASPWTTFFECVAQQVGDRNDISHRMKAEFDTFILDRISKYPPALQIYIPTILALSLSHTEIADIVRLLFCGLAESVIECDNFCSLDSKLLNLATHNFSIDDAFPTLFQDKCRAGEYYVHDRRYLALANQIVGIISPKPGENIKQIMFKEVSWTPDKQVLCLADGSLRLRLYDLGFLWFPKMLLKVPQDLDLAILLRERALQYDGRDMEFKRGRENIARGSLEYIQRCGIPYLKHVHIDTDECIICKECDGAAVVVDMDWQNDPQANAAEFIPSSALQAPSSAVVEGDNHLNDPHGRTGVPSDPSTGPGFGVLLSLSILGMLFYLWGIMLNL